MKRFYFGKNISCLLLGAVVACSLAGCGSGSSSDSDYYANPAEAKGVAYNDYAMGAMAEESYYDGDVYEYEEAAESNGTSDMIDNEAIQATANRKLIKTVNLSVETREFDKLIDTINTKIANLGGYVENSNITGNSYGSTTKRDAYIVARVPAKSIDSFVTCIEQKSNITNKSENAEDVTLQYADVEAHKESLKIEQERLNALLEQADSLESIIELENRLTDVRYELESYESRLRSMDNQIDYGTVYLNVFEVVEYTPEPVTELSFGERFAREFTEGCIDAWDTVQDFIIGFASFLPQFIVILLILAIIFFIVFFIVKGIIAIVKKYSAKHPQKPHEEKAKGKGKAKALDTKPVIGGEESAEAEEKK